MMESQDIFTTGQLNTTKMKSNPTVTSTFASRTSPSTDQSLQKSLQLSSPDKIELKKISSPSKNKKYANTQPDTTKTEKRSIDNGLQGRWTKTTGYNSTKMQRSTLPKKQIFRTRLIKQIPRKESSELEILIQYKVNLLQMRLG